MESRQHSKLDHLAQKCRSLGQILENHIVHIRSKLFSHPRFLPQGQGSRVLEILHQSCVKVFQELIIAKPDDVSASYLA